jgi:hypothetical protein
MEAELEKEYTALATGPLYHLKGLSKSSETVRIYIMQESCQYNIFVRYPRRRELLVSDKFSTRLRRTDSKRSASP